MAVAINEFLTFSPSGRASREAYWFSLFTSLLFWGAGLLAAGFVPPEAWRGNIGFTDPTVAGAALITAVTCLISILLLVTAVIRRLHDLSYNGFAAFFLIIPGLNLICLILLGILKGTSYNRFDPVPSQIPTVTKTDLDAAERVREARAGGKRESARRREEAAFVEAVREGTLGQESSKPFEGVAVELMKQNAAELDEGEKAAQAIYMNVLAGCADEAPSVQIQVKARAIEKLRKLLVKKRITATSFEFWKRRILTM